MPNICVNEPAKSRLNIKVPTETQVPPVPTFKLIEIAFFAEVSLEYY